MTSPVFMQWAAAAASAPRALASTPFTYCDLGGGDGGARNALAAEYPAASFFSIEAALAGAGLPPMDFIAAHGVYSRIDERARDDLHALVRSQLKPGGLLCLQYASLPGSAVHDPLFHYLRLIADRIPGDTAHRFALGFGELDTLRPHAAFFRSQPHAGAVLDSFGDQPPDRLAQAALRRGPHSFYCHEVHDAMAELGLAFMGSAEPRLNHPGLLMSREAFAVFEEVTRNGDRQLRLAAQDLILNTGVRVDVFRKPDPTADSSGVATATASAPARRSKLRGVESLHLKRSGTADGIESRRRASAAVAVDLASPLHSAVLEAVGGEGRTVAATLAAPGLQAFDSAAVEQALAELVAMRFLNLPIAPAPIP